MGSHAHARSICAGSSVTGAFSALHLLRSYSLLAPPSDLCRYDPFPARDYGFGEPDPPRSGSTGETPVSPLTPSSLTAPFSIPTSLFPPPLLAAVPPLIQSINVPQPFSNSANPGTLGNHHFISSNGITNIQQRRPRGEKKPIPEEQKDEKYYERRKRNNQAAKKSRDARKIREDHIALRATMLEHENAILRAQVVTLREEAQSLRHMLIKQQTPGIQTIDSARPLSSVTPSTLSPQNPVTSVSCQV
ncbi:hepatic leukemia factor [Cephus cinctus]|uniref:Hepatic leukemia factor n=1 Tax=Cephus cinctus TaxID=211228 RepID=A0AAJ7C7W7_CEPCN|nr:hepatic leukemia factor [Cephus cinctus]